jgi:hypothetical protein
MWTRGASDLGSSISFSGDEVPSAPLDSLGVYLYARGDRSGITAVEGVSQMAKKPAKPDKKGKK